jgi:hypothetical protein
MNPSGIFPLNLFLPDVNSLFGILFHDIKNNYFTYLNVPESNYSIIFLLVIYILIVLNKNVNFYLVISVFLVFLVLNVLFTFPPSTRFIPNFYFPSILFNSLLPELKILSRNFIFIYDLTIIYTVINFQNYFNYPNVKYKLIFLSLFLLPLNLPYFSLNDDNFVLCNPAIVYAYKFDYWSYYYSTYFNKEIVVMPTLNSSGILNSCLGLINFEN